MQKFLRVFFLLLPLTTCLVLEPATADARNLLDILFGRKQKEEPVYPPPPAPVKKKRIKAPLPQKTNQKAANAKRILVLGDFVASAVADGLNQIYSENVNIVVLSSTNTSSGLVRDDYYNWPINISKFVEKEKPDVIVMTLGANDYQPIKVNGQTVNTDDIEWNNHYRQRIDTLAIALKQTGKPWIWLGQPAFKDQKLSLAITSFNRLYKQQIENAGGHFIDVWDGFVDDQGKFALSGYDVNGQTVRLRTNDGINFTAAGKKKLAFYLEKPLENTFYMKSNDSNGNVTVDPNGPVITMLPRDVDRVAPINFYDMAGQNNGLLGDMKTPKPETSEDKWIPKLGKHKGRADNFSLGQ